MVNPETSKAIKDASFQSALQGLRSGSMTYENDPLLPMLRNEINDRCSGYKSLTAAEETDLLSLNADQKKVVAEADKREKAAYLGQQPNINNPSVKTHPKYLSYVASTGASH